MPTPDPSAPKSRRPLASRNSHWAAQASSALTEWRVTPNQISIGSMGFALLGCLLYRAASGSGAILGGLCLLLAAASVQGRLICNLLDGMVAVEGRRGTADGPFWNEAPDRVSDILLLGGAGLAAGAPALGLLAAALAVSTAYLRELGRAEGFAPDFSGPMAKPQRMAVLTVATVLAVFEPIVREVPGILWLGLWVIVLGTVATILRRSWTLIGQLQRRG